MLYQKRTILTLSLPLSLSDSPSSLFCFKYRRVREPLIHRIAIYITPLYIRVSVCIGAYGFVCACELQRQFPTFHPKDFSFSFLFEIFFIVGGNKISLGHMSSLNVTIQFWGLLIFCFLRRRKKMVIRFFLQRKNHSCGDKFRRT